MQNENGVVFRGIKISAKVDTVPRTEYRLSGTSGR